MELLELERELAGPDSAAALARYDAQLVALQTRLARACAEGLPPADFARCEGLDEAVTVARKLLRLQVRAKSCHTNHNVQFLI